MMSSSPSACIEIKEGTHVAKCVLMPGDPLRAKYIESIISLIRFFLMMFEICMVIRASMKVRKYPLWAQEWACLLLVSTFMNCSISLG